MPLYFFQRWIYQLIIALLGSIFIIVRTKKVKGKKLAVLGMKDAGKTRFYRFLQGKEYVEGFDEETEVDEIEEFDYKLSDGQTIHIEKGYDYGGGRDFIKNYYEDLINKSDIIVFIFDMYRYLYEIEYQKETDSIAELINRYNKDKKNIVKIATRLDLFEKDGKITKKRNNEIRQLFWEKIRNKEYWNILYNFYLINMKENEQIKDVTDKIFKKWKK